MAKIHVTDVIGACGRNTAKAYGGTGHIYQFLDGKWVLWERKADPQRMDALMEGNTRRKRPRHYQPVGMFIRVEV